MNLSTDTRLVTEPKLELERGTNPLTQTIVPSPAFHNKQFLPRHFWGFFRLHTLCTAMDVPPLELKDLVKLPVAAKWKQLGLQLDVPIHTLDEIQANHENSPNFAQECLRDMFYWWLNNGCDVTQERLERGLRDIG